MTVLLRHFFPYALPANLHYPNITDISLCSYSECHLHIYYYHTNSIIQLCHLLPAALTSSIKKQALDQA